MSTLTGIILFDARGQAEWCLAVTSVPVRRVGLYSSFCEFVIRKFTCRADQELKSLVDDVPTVV